MPRVLLVFDEFQVLFARNDKLGIAAAELLETIIRQGRGFGVHVLLGSQTLAGLDALGSHVPPLLPTRILLPAAEADARKVLGDSNNAGDYLTSHGEGMLNAAGGAVEANERFKGALLAEPDRIARLRGSGRRRTAAGFTRRPTVFEGNASVPLDATAPAGSARSWPGPAPAPVRLRSGCRWRSARWTWTWARGRPTCSRWCGDGDEPESASGPAYGLLAAACLGSA